MKVVFFLALIILIGQDCGINSYILYSLVLILFFIGDFKSFYYPRNNLVTPFLFLAILSLLQMWQITQRTILEAGLLILGVICFISKRPFRINIKKLNICVGIALCTVIILTARRLNISYQTYLNSAVGFESSMLSFCIPFFFYYWLRRKDNLFVFLNIFLVLIAGKRIAILACILGFFYYLFRKYLEKPFFPYIMVVANLFYVVISYMLANEFFDDITYHYFHMSVNQFTMGRFALYRIVIERAHIMDHYRWLYGIGLGNTEYLIPEGLSSILHNDVLKILFEFGIIIFCLFFYFIYNKRFVEQWGYILTWNVLLLTDNTMIYVPVIFTIGILIDAERNDLNSFVHSRWQNTFSHIEKKLNNKNPNTYYKNSTEASATGLR